MGQLFEALGLDLKILIAQLVNFAILFAVLYKLGYKPIMKFVAERTATIEEGVKHAEDAKKALADAQQDQDRILAEARKEAQSIITEAREQAVKQADSIVGKSKEQTAKVVDKAKQDIRREHEQMIQQAKAELSDVVLLATEKVLQEKIDAPADKAFVEKTLSQIK